MKASMGQAASVFVAPLSQAARLFAALQETLPAEAATTTAVDTPSTEQAADEEPVPAVEAAEQNPEAVADGSTEG